MVWETILNYSKNAESTAFQFDYKTVHVWRLTLPIAEKMIEEFKIILSLDEVVRAKNFRFETHRKQFIASRAGLRKILSYYLSIPPETIEFSYTSFGKPYLDCTDINFNVSHSGQFILYALTRNTCIGVDIEELNPNIDFLLLAKSIFLKEEYIKFLRLPLKDRPLAFYRCWTRKEAYVKAIGEGLYYPLNEIQVSFLSAEEPKLLSIQSNSLEPNLWQLKEIILDENYVAAIATRQKYINLKLWDWNI